jgi:hypothetical protein
MDTYSKLNKQLKEYAIGDSIVGGYFVIKEPYVSYADFGMSDNRVVNVMCRSFRAGIYIANGDIAKSGKCILLEMDCNLNMWK